MHPLHDFEQGRDIGELCGCPEQLSGKAGIHRDRRLRRTEIGRWERRSCMRVSQPPAVAIRRGTKAATCVPSQVDTFLCSWRPVSPPPDNTMGVSNFSIALLLVKKVFGQKDDY